VKGTTLDGLVDGDFIFFGPPAAGFRYIVRWVDPRAPHAGQSQSSTAPVASAMAVDEEPSTAVDPAPLPDAFESATSSGAEAAPQQADNGEASTQEVATTAPDASAMAVDEEPSTAVDAATLPDAAHGAASAMEVETAATAPATSAHAVSLPRASLPAGEWVPSVRKVLQNGKKNQFILGADARFLCAALHGLLLALADEAARFLVAQGALPLTELSLKNVLRAVQTCIPGQFGGAARTACIKGVGPDGRGRLFDEGRVASALVAARPGLPTLSSEARAGLAAIVEELASELLESAGTKALADPAASGIVYRPAEEMDVLSRSGGDLVFVRERHLREAVAADPELAHLFPSLVRTAAGEWHTAGGAAETPDAAPDEPQAMDVSFAADGAAGDSDVDAEATELDEPLTDVLDAREKAAVTPDVRARFKFAEASVQPKGSFADQGQFPFVQPLLLVQGMAEPLAFPLPVAQAVALRACGQRGPNGTFVPKAELSFGSTAWAKSVAPAFRAALKLLGVRTGVAHAELHGLLLCSGDAVPVRGSLEPGVFGRVEVALPSVRTGGALVVSHDGEEKEFGPTDACAAACDCHWVASYHSCGHRTRAGSGARIVLLYDLVRDKASLPRLLPPCGAHAAMRFGRLAQTWAEQLCASVGTPSPPSKLLYWLNTTQQTAKWADLKLQDEPLLRALVEARDGADPALDVRLLKVKVIVRNSRPSFQYTWLDGPASLPPVLASVASRLKIEAAEFVRTPVPPNQKPDREEQGGNGGYRGDRGLKKDTDGGRSVGSMKPHTPDTEYTKFAVVLWPRRARLQLLAGHLGLFWVINTVLAPALDAVERLASVSAKLLLGFASVDELLRATVRAAGTKEPLAMLTQLVRRGVSLPDLAAYLADALPGDLETQCEFTALLSTAVSLHGCAAMRDPLSRCVASATQDGATEAQSACAWKLVAGLGGVGGPRRLVAGLGGVGGPPGGTALPEQTDEVRAMCAGLAEDLVPRLSLNSRASPAGTSNETVTCALRTLHLLGRAEALTRAAVAIATHPTRFDPIAAVLPALARLAPELPPSVALPALAECVVAGWGDPTCKVPQGTRLSILLSLFVQAGLAERCVPLLLERRRAEFQATTVVLPALSALLADASCKAAVASSAIFGELLLAIARTPALPMGFAVLRLPSYEYSPAGPSGPGYYCVSAAGTSSQIDALVSLFTKAAQFDAAAAADGAPATYREQLAAIVTGGAALEWHALCVVAPAVLRLQGTLDAASRQHPAFSRLVGLGERALLQRLAEFPALVPLKDWRVDVKLQCHTTCVSCRAVQAFLDSGTESGALTGGKAFDGPGYCYQGHTTLIVQAAATACGLFTSKVLSVRTVKKQGILCVCKKAAGQASAEAILAHQTQRKQAEVLRQQLEAMRGLREGIESARRVKQPPADVTKYQRLLRALRSAPEEGGAETAAPAETYDDFIMRVWGAEGCNATPAMMDLLEKEGGDAQIQLLAEMYAEEKCRPSQDARAGAAGRRAAMGAVVRALAEEEQAAQEQLPTPKEAASIAASCATEAAAAGALMPEGVGGGGSSMVEWAVSHFGLEGARLASWVAAHFAPARREAVLNAIVEAEVTTAHHPTHNINTHTHIYAYTHTYVYIYTCIYTYAYTYVYIYMYTCIRSCAARGGAQRGCRGRGDDPIHLGVELYPRLNVG